MENECNPVFECPTCGPDSPLTARRAWIVTVKVQVPRTPSTSQALTVVTAIQETGRPQADGEIAWSGEPAVVEDPESEVEIYDEPQSRLGLVASQVNEWEEPAVYCNQCGGRIGPAGELYCGDRDEWYEPLEEQAHPF